MEFEEIKEQIRAIFKAKGIPDDYLEVPWIMETLLKESIRTLKNNICKSNATGERFTLATQSNKHMTIEKSKDGYYRIIRKYRNGDNEFDDTIYLDKYGFEENRVCRLNGEKILQLVRRANGTIIESRYNNKNNKLSQDSTFLNSGSCFLVNDKSMEIMGTPIIIHNYERGKVIAASIDSELFEKAYNVNKKRLLERYPNAKDYYAQLDDQTKSTLLLINYYNEIMLACKEGHAETYEALGTNPLNNTARGSNGIEGDILISLEGKKPWREKTPMAGKSRKTSSRQSFPDYPTP